jgi:hypothetical protein
LCHALCRHVIIFSFRDLVSLEELKIIECENLKSFLEDGLPPSLLKLEIYGCSLLKESCKKDKGRDWFEIAHIPCVMIDGWFIYDPEEHEPHWFFLEESE